jgi:plastocyanin
MKANINKSETSAMRILLQVAFLLFMTACTKSSTMNPVGDQGNVQGANEVYIQNMAFNPSTLTVPVNTTVIWTNKDGMAHTVTSSNALFDSGPISSGSIFTRQFTTAGTFSYFCSIHTVMTGKIVVQ